MLVNLGLKAEVRVDPATQFPRLVTLYLDTYRYALLLWPSDPFHICRDYILVRYRLELYAHVGTLYTSYVFSGFQIRMVDLVSYVHRLKRLRRGNRK
jgi:hypothetical protein